MGAVACYSEILQHDGNFIPVLLNRAMAQIRLNNFSAAEDDCSRVLSIENGNVKALFRRGLARHKLGKLSESLEDLESAQSKPGIVFKGVIEIVIVIKKLWIV